MKISIVTPSFRQLEWLQLCIASVADQTGVEVEHIVQDAGTPGFEEFVRKTEKIWPNRRNYRRRMVQEPDLGMYDAIHRGLKKAQGQLLAYLNCDEQYLPGTLAFVWDWFRDHPKAEICHGDVIVCGTKGDYRCHRKALVPKKMHTLVSGSLSFFTAATFFRGHLVKEGFNFSPIWKVVGDAEWAYRLLAARKSFSLCNSYLSVFTDTGENLALSRQAQIERERWSRLAPRWARVFRAFVVAWYRMEKILAGGYRVPATPFRIYQLSNPEKRSTVRPAHPTFRWKPGKG